MSCNNDDEISKTPVTEYYNMEELLKLHNGVKKRGTRTSCPSVLKITKQK